MEPPPTSGVIANHRLNRALNKLRRGEEADAAWLSQHGMCMIEVRFTADGHPVRVPFGLQFESLKRLREGRGESFAFRAGVHSTSPWWDDQHVEGRIVLKQDFSSNELGTLQIAD